MKPPFFLAALAVALAAGIPPASAQVAPKIPLEKLQTMFANMRAQTHWNVDGPLLWGYFFLDADRDKLAAAGDALVAKGYRLVDIAKVDGRSDYRLHVERVEAHTPESLYARDIELEALARRLHIRSYDGMDAGPALTTSTASGAAR